VKIINNTLIKLLSGKICYKFNIMLIIAKQTCIIQ
jgi:hypothetical protein